MWSIGALTFSALKRGTQPRDFDNFLGAPKGKKSGPGPVGNFSRKWVYLFEWNAVFLCVIVNDPEQKEQLIYISLPLTRPKSVTTISGMLEQISIQLNSHIFKTLDLSH